MQVIRTLSELRSWRAEHPDVGLVPTMGNLHAGHIELVRVARRYGETIATTIFVNPTQFGPNEDFASYPRTLEADLAQLEAAGNTMVFVPEVETMYPDGPTVTRVLPGPLASELCGAHRPGHFDGVLTVVSKLFHLVQPRFACFGRKDFQQLTLIRQMVRDLNFPLEIIPVPIVRADDGLALSSRNIYLSADERSRALVLPRTLQWVADALRTAPADVAGIEAQAMNMLRERGFVPDYVSVRTEADLATMQHARGAMIVLAAARMGKTRLIDNLCFELPA
jgi:pantoate--beta-alanine ligase